MPVVRGQFHQLLVAGARTVMVDEYNELPAVYPEIFNVEDSSRAFEDDQVMAGLPVAVSRGEAEPIPFDRPVYRGSVRYIHSGYALGYEISREAIEDDQYKVINNNSATNLARSLREAEEISAASVFNNATGSVMAYDGVPLLSTAHPGVGGLTFANRPAVDVDLSVAALKAMSERRMLLQNDRGLRIRVTQDTLLVPVQNWWTASEILGAEFNPTGAMGDETPNVTRGMGLNPLAWAHLTDPDAWYVLAPKAMRKLYFFWRTRPDDVSGTDERNQVAWFGILGRWSAGATDWRWIDGSPGA